MRLRLFHGTAHKFEAFDDRFVLRGSEPNSALGIHLTEVPANAAHYAELSSRDRHAVSPRVLVVEVDIKKVAIIGSVDEFMGGPLDLPPVERRPREDFVAARHELEALGFEGIALDTPIDDLVGTWVIFSPEKISLIGEMSVDEAYELEPEDPDWTDIEMVSSRLFDETAMATMGCKI